MPEIVKFPSGVVGCLMHNFMSIKLSMCGFQILVSFGFGFGFEKKSVFGFGFGFGFQDKTISDNYNVNFLKLTCCNYLKNTKTMEPILSYLPMCSGINVLLLNKLVKPTNSVGADIF